VGTEAALKIAAGEEGIAKVTSLIAVSVLDEAYTDLQEHRVLGTTARGSNLLNAVSAKLIKGRESLTSPLQPFRDVIC